ncbi:hypothetical protein ACP70R_043102 [Stipagrostis hirtigluma subsp. patula]
MSARGTSRSAQGGVPMLDLNGHLDRRKISRELTCVAGRPVSMAILIEEEDLLRPWDGNHGNPLWEGAL